MFSYEEYALIPLWEGDTTHRETVMFIGNKDRAPLLYKPTKILSVTSYTGDTAYEEGVDFLLNANASLSLTENTRIPYIEEKDYYHDDPSSLIYIPYKGKDTYIYWGEGTTMTQWQIAVTYTHEPEDILPVPTDFSHRYATFLQKMGRGEDVTIFFYGDSITVGGNSSHLCNIPPYMPSWALLFTERLAQKYGYTVRYTHPDLKHLPPSRSQDLVFGTRGTLTYINTAVGGWNSTQGIENLGTRVTPLLQEYGCDLFVLGHGMNDKRLTPAEYLANLRKICDTVLEFCNRSALLLVSTMYPNPDAPRWCINQPQFEPHMYGLANAYTESGTPCAVAPVTSMSRHLLSRKRFCDYAANNINHPNDFMIRLYAQTMLRTLLGE